MRKAFKYKIEVSEAVPTHSIFVESHTTLPYKRDVGWGMFFNMLHYKATDVEGLCVFAPGGLALARLTNGEPWVISAHMLPSSLVSQTLVSN